MKCVHVVRSESMKCLLEIIRLIVIVNAFCYSSLGQSVVIVVLCGEEKNDD